MALIPEELTVTPVPITVLVNVGVSVSVTVAPTPDAVAVKLLLTKLISPTLLADPATDPSSLIVIPELTPVRSAPEPINDVAVIIPVGALIPDPVIVVPPPTIIVLKLIESSASLLV